MWMTHNFLEKAFSPSCGIVTTRELMGSPRVDTSQLFGKHVFLFVCDTYRQTTCVALACGYLTPFAFFRFCRYVGHLQTCRLSSLVVWIAHNFSVNAFVSSCGIVTTGVTHGWFRVDASHLFVKSCLVFVCVGYTCVGCSHFVRKICVGFVWIPHTFSGKRVWLACGSLTYVWMGHTFSGKLVWFSCGSLTAGAIRDLSRVDGSHLFEKTCFSLVCDTHTSRDS